MCYFDLKRHWTKRIESHRADRTLNAVLVRDFNTFTLENGNAPLTHGQFPRDFESCDG